MTVGAVLGLRVLADADLLRHLMDIDLSRVRQIESTNQKFPTEFFVTEEERNGPNVAQSQLLWNPSEAPPGLSMSIG